MDAINVVIEKFVDPAQPGWVECSLVDAAGYEWRFVDKAPVFSATHLDENSAYPQDGVIACKVVESWNSIGGREILRVDTSVPWDVESTTGQTVFEVFRDQMSTI